MNDISERSQQVTCLKRKHLYLHRGECKEILNCVLCHTHQKLENTRLRQTDCAMTIPEVLWTYQAIKHTRELLNYDFWNCFEVFLSMIEFGCGFSMPQMQVTVLVQQVWKSIPFQHCHVALGMWHGEWAHENLQGTFRAGNTHKRHSNTQLIPLESSWLLPQLFALDMFHDLNRFHVAPLIFSYSTVLPTCHEKTLLIW